jgi:hypothetical protein
VRKFRPATPAQVAANRRLAMAWFEQAKAFAPSLHLVETPHFLIFSAAPVRSDARLGGLAETMYAALARQFAIRPQRGIWAGKCPIYVLASAEQYRRFTDEVDRRKLPDAAGYHSQRSDGFCYIVLNRVGGATSFQALLVHEGTHAFLGRYLTNRPIVAWVNEGLAEMMAARLVPASDAARRYVDATRQAVREKRDVTPIFREVRLKRYDYGLAQSLVRFLIARDRGAFGRFIRRMKEGAREAEALQAAYGLTHDQLRDEWLKAASKAIRRARP